MSFLRIVFCLLFILYTLQAIAGSPDSTSSADDMVAKWRVLSPSRLGRIDQILQKARSLQNFKRGGDVSGGGDDYNLMSLEKWNADASDIKKLIHFQNELVGLNSVQDLGHQGRVGRIAVIDSGMSAEAPVAKNVVYFHDFTGSCPTSSMCDGALHGTLVTDLIVQGAPKAEIVSLKILNQHLKGKFSYLKKSLEWIRDNHKKFNIRVVNLSLTSPEILSGEWNDDDAMRELVKKLSEQNILFISATGNGFSRNVNFFPASLPEVLTVGSFEHGFTLDAAVHLGSYFNNSGYISVPETKTEGDLFWKKTTRTFYRSVLKPDVLAPGELVTACAETCYVTSGSSFASAIVAGGVLNLVEAMPYLSMKQLQALMKGAGLSTIDDALYTRKWKKMNFNQLILFHKNQGRD